jgi:hypothetical protein
MYCMSLSLPLSLAAEEILFLNPNLESRFQAQRPIFPRHGKELCKMDFLFKGKVQRIFPGLMASLPPTSPHVHSQQVISGFNHSPDPVRTFSPPCLA